MSIRKVAFVAGEFYHVYNRGNSKQVIFHDKQDYNRFLSLLYAVNTKENIVFRLVFEDIYKYDRGERLVSIGAYCLMSNHFHLLLTETEDGSISKFMQKLTTAYSMYYNEKYERTGSLFEGKFKSEHANNDRYLKYLFSYIHLNPIKLTQKDWKEKGINDIQKSLNFLNNYKWSSYLDHRDIKRKENKIINLIDFPKYFSNLKNFDNEMLEWLSFKDIE